MAAPAWVPRVDAPPRAPLHGARDYTQSHSSIHALLYSATASDRTHSGREPHRPSIMSALPPPGPNSQYHSLTTPAGAGSFPTVSRLGCHAAPHAVPLKRRSEPIPLFAYRMKPRPHAVALDSALAAGSSPFDLVADYVHNHNTSNLSSSAKSAWNVYARMCAQFGWPVTPLSATGLVGFMIGYVRIRGNSSASLPSRISQLHSFCNAQRPPIAWPDFVAETGETMSKHISRIQKDWPAEICPAPELMYATGLCAAIAYLESLPPNLWTLQWLAIMSLMHALLLRPSDIIPLNELPVAEGTFSGYAFPRRGDLTILDASAAPPHGELRFFNPLYKTNKLYIDRRKCTPATIGLGDGAAVDAVRLTRRYLEAAGLWNAPYYTPIFHYRNRDGSPRGHMSRAVLLAELREHILAPAGVPEWHKMQLRSFRPGGASDLRAAGLSKDVVHTVGKWASVAGLAPYDRADRYMLQHMQPFRQSIVDRQQAATNLR